MKLKKSIKNFAATAIGSAVFMATIPAAQAQVSSTERQALIDFYQSTNGPNWTNKAGWLGAVGTECQWYGVFCSSKNSLNYYVTSLTFNDNNLQGQIPSLSGLNNLMAFSAFNNKLIGNIPSLSGLNNLMTFSIVSNQLTGSIPSLSGLNNLSAFSADDNQLIGGIPSLSGLNNLMVFSVSSNYLTGDIPSLSGLNNLVHFSVGSNQLTGSIPSLSGLNNLINFSVEANKISGSLSEPPPALLARATNGAITGTGAHLCGNQLVSAGNAQIDSAWDRINYFNNQITPWQTCQTSSAPVPTLARYTITSNPSNGGSGLCNANPLGSNNFECTATAQPGYQFVGFSGDCVGQTCVVQGQKNVTANFERIAIVTPPTPISPTIPVTPPTPTLTEYNILSNPSDAGSGLCNVLIPGSNNFECTATAKPGYQFVGFSGDCVGQTCVVQGQKNVTANFQKIGIQITPTANPPYGGSLVCTPNAVVYNDSVTCVAQPNPGYEVSAYFGACAGTTGTLCTINNVQTDLQAGVTFINQDQGVYLSFGGYCDIIRFDRVIGSEVFYGRNIPESCDGDALMFARIVETNGDIFVTMVGGYVQDGSGQSSALKLLDLKLDRSRTNLSGDFTAKAVKRGNNEQSAQITGNLSGTWTLNTNKGSGTYAATAAYGATTGNQMRAKMVAKPSIFKTLAP